MKINDLPFCIKNNTSYCLADESYCDICKPCIPDFSGGSKRQPVWDYEKYLKDVAEREKQRENKMDNLGRLWR